jgi:hypothetical protein
MDSVQVTTKVSSKITVCKELQSRGFSIAEINSIIDYDMNKIIRELENKRSN